MYLFVIALSAVLIVAAAVVAALFATGVIGNGGGSQAEEVSESSGDDAVETGGGDAAELDDEDARAATAVVEDLNDMFDELLANGLSDDDVTEFGYDVMTLMPSSFVESIIERELEGDADQFPWRLAATPLLLLSIPVTSWIAAQPCWSSRSARPLTQTSWTS